jgi:acetyl-CoA carboxylase biotin carboxyl carrier protein
MKIEELEQIINILKQNDVNEFDFDNDGIRIRLSRGNPAPVYAPAPQVVGGYNVDIQPVVNTVTVPAASTADKPAAAEVANNHFKVESPIVGTFYRKPSPDAQPFVSEGMSVTKGQTLCIIEAMKLMNEIESPISGKIEKVNVSDGQVVEFGEILFLINPGA